MFNARLFLQTMITLASASLGLVAALAWNEAIKTTIKTYFGAEDNLAGLYTYAILATVIAVVVVMPAGPCGVQNWRGGRHRARGRRLVTPFSGHALCESIILNKTARQSFTLHRAAPIVSTSQLLPEPLTKGVTLPAPALL